MREMQFYYDPLSPWVFLALKKIQLLKQVGVSVSFVPVSIFLIHSLAPKGEGQITFQNSTEEFDFIKSVDPSVKAPAKFPFNSVLAQRLCVALENQHQRQELAALMIESVWTKEFDVENEEYLKMMVLSLGMSVEELWKKAYALETKELLKMQSVKAAQLGIRELPALRVGEEVIQGRDCLDFLDKTLKEYSDTN